MDQHNSPKKAKFSTNEEIMSATAVVSHFLECSRTPGCRFISILVFWNGYNVSFRDFFLLFHPNFGVFCSFLGKLVRFCDIPVFVVIRKFQRIDSVKYFVKLNVKNMLEIEQFHDFSIKLSLRSVHCLNCKDYTQRCHRAEK